ncbi:MAG: hypothetical protein ABFD79_06290 [Phycisphaerales bacterium]
MAARPQPALSKDKLLLHNSVLYRVIADLVVTNIHAAPDSRFSPDHVKCKLIIPIADVSGWCVGTVLEILGTPHLDKVKPIIFIGSNFVEIDSDDDVQHLDKILILSAIKL